MSTELSNMRCVVTITLGVEAGSSRDPKIVREDIHVPFNTHACG